MDSNSSPWIERVTSALTQLPEEDLPLVAEFVEHLKRQRRSPGSSPASIAEVRAEARRRARELRGIPRADIARRFAELAAAIRQSAIAQGTDVEWDWEGD